MANILIVDDDPGMLSMLTVFLERNGHDAKAVSNLMDGLNKAQAGAFDLILLDVNMPDGCGLDFLPQFREVTSSPEVLIITGKGDKDGAEKAIKSGAWGYIEKTYITRELKLHLTRALEYRAEKNRTEHVPVSLKRENIIGNSPAISKCLDRIAKAAATDISILLTGETGTGKEFFARAIHDNSDRADKSFIVVDCASLPESLIESTLFGHVKGAFTGAAEAMDGLVKLADGGTLFLDEVGELPLQLQKTFLRVLQERRFRPVGASGEIFSDFRLVVATNRNLEEMVQEGIFRQDLLFRLQAFSIQLPPLRERLEDIKELTAHFIRIICERYHKEIKGFGPDFITTLSSYDWPGNVRELFQALEQAYTLAFNSPTLFTNHLPEKIRICQARTAVSATKTSSVLPVVKPPANTLQPFQEAKDSFEKEYLDSILSLTNANITAASKIAGLSRTHFYRLLTKHNLPV